MEDCKTNRINKEKKSKLHNTTLLINRVAEEGIKKFFKAYPILMREYPDLTKIYQIRQF